MGLNLIQIGQDKMPGKNRKFTTKGDRALKDVIKSINKYGRKGTSNPYAIVTAKVPNSRIKSKKKRR
jgi:hypothetical protein